MKRSDKKAGSHKKPSGWSAAVLFFLVTTVSHAMTDVMTCVVNLNGPCRFEIGNLPEYADLKYDDSLWERIHAPGSWESQGFPGYNGYAWYRFHFKLSRNHSGAELYLNLGLVDDVDRVYINGHFLNGCGTFPPQYHSAWDKKRIYPVSNEHLNFDGDNCLAVQVYDDGAEGGIVRGNIGLYSRKQPFQLALSLAGEWKFMPGDNPEWMKNDCIDHAWPTVSVPGKWEHNGYADLDGFAWYRKAFVLPKFMSGDRWILILGRIDDADEVYVNGLRIGQTGDFPDRSNLTSNTGFGILRLYSIPRSLLQSNRKNIIAVRVFDKGLDGGIYEGPVGLISRDTYLKYKKIIK